MAVDLQMKDPNLRTLFHMSYEELYDTFGARISGFCSDKHNKFNRFGASFHVLFQVEMASIVALKGLETLRWLTKDGYVVEIDSLKRVFVYDFNKPDCCCRFAILDYHLLAVAMNNVLMF